MAARIGDGNSAALG
jgi:hypothetical protein